jgi:spermidine synthase
MQAAARPQRRVLILGGGDGLALREVLRHRQVEHVTLVDLDPAMTALSTRVPALAALNLHAFDDPRVEVINEDALIWLEQVVGSLLQRPIDRWDVIIIDFPDPNTFAVGKLYTRGFYRLVRQALRDGGSVAVQATSPLFARRSFWCIARTLEAAGFEVHPYHTTVPSFGVWGFMLARKESFPPPRHPPAQMELRYLNDHAMAQIFSFSGDMAAVPAEINQLDSQLLVRYYESEWRRWE